MNTHARDALNAAAMLLVLFTAMIEPLAAFILACGLLLVYAVWEWIEVRRVARK